MSGILPKAGEIQREFSATAPDAAATGRPHELWLWRLGGLDQGADQLQPWRNEGQNRGPWTVPLVILHWFWKRKV